MESGGALPEGHCLRLAGGRLWARSPTARKALAAGRQAEIAARRRSLLAAKPSSFPCSFAHP